MNMTERTQNNISPDNESKIRNIAGTLAIEGITLSETSRNNLERIMSGQATYQQIINEITAKYRKSK